MLFAAEKGFVEAVRVLTEFGADFDILNNTGATPVHMAAVNGDKEVVKLLRKLGADMTAVLEQFTPADLVSQQGHSAMAD